MNLKHVFVIAATLLMFSMSTVKPETLSLTDDRVSQTSVFDQYQYVTICDEANQLQVLWNQDNGISTGVIKSCSSNPLSQLSSDVRISLIESNVIVLDESPSSDVISFSIATNNGGGIVSEFTAQPYMYKTYQTMEGALDDELPTEPEIYPSGPITYIPTIGGPYYVHCAPHSNTNAAGPIWDFMVSTGVHVTSPTIINLNPYASTTPVCVKSPLIVDDLDWVDMQYKYHANSNNKCEIHNQVSYLKTSNDIENPVYSNIVMMDNNVTYISYQNSNQDCPLSVQNNPSLSHGTTTMTWMNSYINGSFQGPTWVQMSSRSAYTVESQSGLVFRAVSFNYRAAFTHGQFAMYNKEGQPCPSLNSANPNSTECGTTDSYSKLSHEKLFSGFVADYNHTPTFSNPTIYKAIAPIHPPSNNQSLSPNGSDGLDPQGVPQYGTNDHYRGYYWSTNSVQNWGFNQMVPHTDLNVELNVKTPYCPQPAVYKWKVIISFDIDEISANSSGINYSKTLTYQSSGPGTFNQIIPLESGPLTQNSHTIWYISNVYIEMWNGACTQSGLPYYSLSVIDSDYGTPLTLYIV